MLNGDFHKNRTSLILRYPKLMAMQVILFLFLNKCMIKLYFLCTNVNCITIK